jgi:hypothetical protein
MKKKLNLKIFGLFCLLLINASNVFADYVFTFDMTGASGLSDKIYLLGSTENNGGANWSNRRAANRIPSTDCYTYTVTGTISSGFQFDIYLTETGGSKTSAVNWQTDISKLTWQLSGSNMVYCADCCQVSEPDPIVIRWKNEAGWSDMAIYAWIDDDDPITEIIEITEITDPWPGNAVTPDDGWYSYTFNESPVNFIFNDNSETESIPQTLAITGITSSSCYIVRTNAANNGYDVISIDCNPAEPHTYTVTAPAGTKTVYLAIQNTDDPWTDDNTSFRQMEWVSDNTFAITLETKANYKYKYCASTDWENVELTSTGGTVADRTYTSEINTVAQWQNSPFVNFIPVAGQITVWFYKPYSWNTVKIYAWGGTNTNDPAFASGTKGVAMADVGNGWYAYTFPAGVSGFNCLFNNDNWGGANQTGNSITITSDICFRNSGLVVTDCYPSYTWAGSSDNNYNNVKNWEIGNATPAVFVPYALSNITIPASANYPVLCEPITFNECDEITFNHGAQIGRPDRLTYNKAHVQLDYTQTGMRGRWHMMSMPIKGIVSGDMAFGGEPAVFLRKFATNGTQTINNSFIPGTWSEYYNSNIIEFNPGEGFIMWVNNNTYSSTNLDNIEGVLELPCFENTEEAVNKGNPFHSYANGVSLFQPFETSSEPPTATNDEPEPYQRPNDSYQLNTEDILYPVTFDAGGLALVGNPFMSSIDFADLLADEDNAGHIQPDYKIFTGNTFTTYSEVLGNCLPIAPMQSFIISKAEESDNQFDFNFDVTKTGANNAAALRSATVVSNKLEIVASAGANTIRTYIVDREDGTADFGYWDSRKLLLGITKIPEIYTIKDYNSGKIGVDINVINADNRLIPLAVATSYEGEMTLTFNGIDNYDSQITLIDHAENREIPLSGSSATYPFNYVPAKVNNKIVADEGRFAIRFGPNAPTGSTPATNDWISVYSKDQTIYAASTPSDPIREIAVYSMQGALVYANRNINRSSCSFTKKSLLSEIYLVKVTTEKGVKNVKLIVK